MATLKDVPENEVLQIIEEFILGGNTNIMLKKQLNEKWTIEGEIS